MGRRPCEEEGCSKGAIAGPHCIAHGGGKRCQHEGCPKSASFAGGTQQCRAHGGGRRCQTANCIKGAESNTQHCVSHGGGKRCQHEDCFKSAVAGGTPHCIAHGGGKRCQHEGCSKSARGYTQYCVVHGGGRRCQQEGCFKSAVAGGTLRCIAHGGGRRCQHEGCTKSVARLAGSKYCSACAADVESAEEERAEARGGEASTAQWDQMVSEMGAGRLSGGDEFAACGSATCVLQRPWCNRRAGSVCLLHAIRSEACRLEQQ